MTKLDPIAELTADGHSYGFRKERCCQDAIQQCHTLLSHDYSPKWVLEGDIKGCFDHISHEWMLEHIPTDKEILRKWLKCGVIFNGEFYKTEEGTMQGGIISPTLAHMTLDGIQTILDQKYVRRSINGKLYSPKVNMVRYADDFIITSESREVLETEIKPMLVDFLAERGLELSQEKTVITHIDDGFDFLGFNIRKYNGVLLTQPAKKCVKKFMEAKNGGALFCAKYSSGCCNESDCAGDMHTMAFCLQTTGKGSGAHGCAAVDQGFSHAV